MTYSLTWSEIHDAMLRRLLTCTLRGTPRIRLVSLELREICITHLTVGNNFSCQLGSFWVNKEWQLRRKCAGPVWAWPGKLNVDTLYVLLRKL